MTVNTQTHTRISPEDRAATPISLVFLCMSHAGAYHTHHSFTPVCRFGGRAVYLTPTPEEAGEEPSHLDVLIEHVLFALDQVLDWESFDTTSSDIEIQSALAAALPYASPMKDGSRCLSADMLPTDHPAQAAFDHLLANAREIIEDARYEAYLHTAEGGNEIVLLILEEKPKHCEEFTLAA